MIEALLNKVTALFNDSYFIEEIAQIKSKSLLKEISKETVKTIKWNFNETIIVNNITAANFIVQG